MRKNLSVLLALMMVLSTVSFALPSAITVYDAVNEFISEAYSEENAELSGDEWSNTEKGYKLFVIDFETKNDGTALVSSDYSAITNSRVDATATTKTGGVAVSAVGRTNPNYTVNARVNVKGGSGASLSGTDNKYLTLSTAGDSLIFSQLYVGDGTYVFEFETDTVTYNAIRGSYNAGVTPTATAKDGTWYATSHTAANMTEALSTSCSSYGTDNIRFHFSTTPTMYDNIVVYYQPTGWTSPSTGNEGGEEDEGAADTQSWTHPTYGTKLFNMDFDTNNNGEAVAEAALSGINGGKISSGSEGILVSTVGQINPELSADEASDYRVSLYDGTGNMTYSLESVGDSQGLGFIATGSYKPSLYIGGVYDKAGSYTIVIDYKYDDGGSGVAHNNIQFANPTATYYDGTLSSGSLETVPYTLEYTDSDTYISQRIVFYCNGSTDTFTGSEKFIIDNLSVYYYDENIDYTEPEEPSTDIWESTEYGTKLYEVNFDTKLDGTTVTETDLSGIDSGRLDQDLSAGILVSNIGKVNPNIDATYSEDYRISVKDLTYSLGTADGKTFLDIKSTTEKPCIMLGGFNDRDGDYTIVIDYRYLKNTSSYTHDRLYMHTHNQNVDSSLLSNESWATAPYSFSTLDGDVYKTNYMRMVFYSVGNVFTGVEEFQIDKISVYYKAKTTVKVTVSANGNADMSDVVMSDISASGVRVADILARITNNSGKQLLGISATADGVTLSAGETITPADGATLYMIWGNEIVDKEITWTDSEKGYLLYDLDFETEKHYVKNNDELSLFGAVNTNIINNGDWYITVNYYEDLLPGTGTATYEPKEGEIRYEYVDGKYNKYLSIKPDGTTCWPQVGIMAYAVGSSNYTVFGGANGIYTIEGDVRAILADGSNYSYTSIVVDMATYDETSAKYTSQTQITSVGYTYTTGEWATISGVLDNADYDGLSRIKPCNQYSDLPIAGADEIHFDNFKLYWKPYTVNVTFDNSAVATMSNQTVSVSTENPITVGDLKKLVKSDGLMELKGLSKAKGGVLLSDDTVIDFFGNLTFYTVWEQKDMTGWTHDDYGILVYDLDFNSSESFTTSTLASLYGRVNPNLTDSENWTISSHYLKDAEIVDDGSGNKYLKMSVDGTNEYPQIQVNANVTDSYVFSSDGNYTLMADIKVVSADGYMTNTLNSVSLALHGATNTDGVWSYTQEGGGWSTSDKTALSSDFVSALGTFNCSSYDGVSKIIYCMSYGEVPTADIEALYIDNLRLYWKPSYVTVTVKPGENKLAREHAIKVSTSGVSVSDIMTKVVDHGDMILKGISNKAGGSALSGTLTLSSDTTLYALWEETGEVLSEYSVEFEKDESSGIDVYWKNHGTNSEGNGYVRNTDGHGVFTFNAKKEHSAVWDSNISFTSFVSKATPAGEIKAIMVRMRYRNVPYFDCSCATDVNSHVHEYKTGSTNTYDNKKQMMQFYYLTPDTTKMSESQSLKYNFSVADGDGIENDWFTFYIDVSENADFRDKGISDLRLDFNNDVWDGTVIDIDYIRFIGDKSKAPVTQNTNSIKTTDPLGIRFMASLKKELVESSSSYGWVIAREVSLAAAGLSNSDFSYEAATEKSVAALRGVNFGEGREEALTLSEDSVNVYFTAMLYNIPSDMYEDKLVARPFAVVDDVTYYGAPLSKSVYDVAKALRDGGFSGCTAAQQTYIQRVIDKVEMA